ncbi:MAG: ABC transporter ATP-binding protein, partial [Scrofimicrobium sp.]
MSGPHAGGGRGRGGQGGTKAKDFKGTLSRVLGLVSDYKWLVLGVSVASVLSVVASVAAPRILGQATNLIVAGAIGQHMPAGSSKEQVIEALRAKGESDQANMVEAMN